MGHSQSSSAQHRSQQKQISLENIRAERPYRSDTSRTTKSPNKKHTLRSIFSNDVELIVRKKLITTTTTTTANPVELNSLANEANVEADQQKDQNDEINNGNQISTMHRVVNNANPENTADAVAALMKDYSEANDSVIRSPSAIDIDDSTQFDENNNNRNSLTNISVSDAPGNNRRVSTFKKEQLEYEFRIKPQTSNKKKRNKRKNKNSLITFDERSENRSAGENTENMVIYRRLYCCGLKCCQFPLNFTNANEESIYSSATFSRACPSEDNNFDAQQVSCCCFTQNNSAFVRFMQLICCCFIFRNQKYFKVFGKKFYFQNASEQPSFYGSNSNQPSDTLNNKNSSNKLEKECDSYECRSWASKTSFRDRLKRGSTKRKENSKTKREDDDILTEEPAVTCIRVLRPSNDLTPVKFDSQYNIIQAYNTESTTLICNNNVDNTINEFDINEIEN